MGPPKQDKGTIVASILIACELILTFLGPNSGKEDLGGALECSGVERMELGVWGEQSRSAQL